MQNKIKFMLFFFLYCAAAALAQQPQWELFFPNISGPIAVDPTDSDIIYIASGKALESGMWKTKDSGQTWNLYSEGWGMGTPRDILINPDNPQEILVSGGPFVGVLKSTDGGQTWVRADYGLKTDHHGYEVHQLAFDNQKSIYFLADVGGGAFCGVYRSVDGVQWEETSFYGCPLSVIVDEANGNVYASSDVGDIRKSADAGSTWVEKNNGLPTNSPAIWDVAKVNNREAFYAASFYGIYKTHDDGDNWFSVNDSIMSQLNFNGGLTVADADTNTVFAGARATSDVNRPGGVYLSRDGGISWELNNWGLPDTVSYLSAQDLFLDNERKVLYASIFSHFGGFGEGNIFVLRDFITTDVRRYPQQTFQDALGLTNYPNPFNTQTNLFYTINERIFVSISIFDILGKEVMHLLADEVSPGEYHIAWDGKDSRGQVMASGIYFARMQAGREARTIKLLMLK